MSVLCMNFQQQSCSCSKHFRSTKLPKMQEKDMCRTLQAPEFLPLFCTTLYTVVHARSKYIIASLPITCTFSCNFRYYELSLFSRIRQPSSKFLSLLLCTPSCVNGKIRFGTAFSVLRWRHIVSQELLFI